jgi:hypothetical protein
VNQLNQLSIVRQLHIIIDTQYPISETFKQRDFGRKVPPDDSPPLLSRGSDRSKATPYQALLGVESQRLEFPNRFRKGMEGEKQVINGSDE